jgi:hypothetical protein
MTGQFYGASIVEIVGAGLIRMTRDMRPLHTAFRRWLKDTIEANSEAVVLSLSPSMPAEQLYELLVPNYDTRTKLLLAAECLPAQSEVCSYSFELPVRLRELELGVALPFQVFLKVPEDWGTILLPALEHRAYLGNNNVLTELLLPSIKMAQQWAKFKHCTNHLLNLTNDRAAVREMFPWIVEAVKDCEWTRNPNRFYSHHGIGNNVQEQKDCDRTFNEVITMYRGYAPRMTTAVREICLSGGKLFSQVRMAKTVDGDRFDRMQQRTMNSSSIVPKVSDKMVPNSIDDDLKSIAQLHAARLPKKRVPGWKEKE